jgi:hypothetical protein
MNLCSSEWEPALGSGRHSDRLVGSTTNEVFHDKFSEH